MSNRYSKQSQQEQISRSQISEHFQQYGWIIGSVEPDLGEDLLVRLYENNQSTGLSCFIQLKSTKTIEKLKLKNGKYSYSFEVKDLIHWHISTTPIILVIWDVIQKRGLWRDIDSIIAELNTNKTNWKSSKKIRVHFSPELNLDELGLKVLKRTLVIKLEPSMMKRDPLNINLKLSFANTPEGNKKLEELERSIDYGDRFEITGKAIKEFNINEWFKKFHGWVEPSEKAIIMWEPSKNDRHLFVSLQTKLNQNILQKTEFVKLNNDKSGRRYVTLSNKDDDNPFLLELVFDNQIKSIKFNYSLLDKEINVSEALNAIEFLDSMALSDEVQIRVLGINDRLISKSTTAQERVNEEFITLIKRACYIQEKSGIQLKIQEFILDDETALMISDINSIYENGYFSINNRNLNLQINNDGISQLIEHFERLDTIKIKATDEDSEATLLGATIPLGDSEWDVVAKLSTKIEELKILTDKNTDKDHTVVLSIIEGTRKFLNWTK